MGDHLVDLVEATEDLQVLLDQEDQLVILVFKEKLDKEVSPGYLVCLVLQDHLDLKEIVDTSEMQVHLAMWDLPVLVLLELKVSEVLLASLVKEAYLADRDPLVPLATVNSVTICKLKQTDKQTKKDPKHFIMLGTLIESNIFYFIHTVVKSLKKYNLKKSLIKKKKKKKKS